MRVLSKGCSRSGPRASRADLRALSRCFRPMPGQMRGPVRRNKSVGEKSTATKSCDFVRIDHRPSPGCREEGDESIVALTRRPPAGGLHKCRTGILQVHFRGLPSRCTSGGIVCIFRMKHARSVRRALRGSRVLSPGAAPAPSRSRFERADSHVARSTTSRRRRVRNASWCCLCFHASTTTWHS